MAKRKKEGPPRDFYKEGADAYGADLEATPATEAVVPSDVAEAGGQDGVDQWVAGWRDAANMHQQEIDDREDGEDDRAEGEDHEAEPEGDPDDQGAEDAFEPTPADEGVEEGAEVVQSEPTAAEGEAAAVEETPAEPAEVVQPVVETPTPGPEVVKRRTMVRLEQALDDHQLADLARRLVDNHDDQLDVEKEAKDARETYKGRLSALEQEADLMRKAVHSGRGWVDVEAEEFLIFNGRKVATRRVDTGEQVAIRDAAGDDLAEIKAAEAKRQAAIPGTEPAASESVQNVRDFYDSCLVADPSDDLARAWEKGTAAFERGKSSDLNPYPADSLLAKRWDKAFAEAALAEHEKGTEATPDVAADAASDVATEGRESPGTGEAMVETEGDTIEGDGSGEALPPIVKNCATCGAEIAEAKLEAGEEELCEDCGAVAGPTE